MAKISIVVDRDLEDLIPGFLVNRDKDLIKLETALAQRDFETIRILGHSMKGFGSGYGFDYISEVGLELENTAQSSDVERIEVHIQSIKDYLKNIEITYED
jgi:HPt (histidine-containing phosphotransfer) domain-containing protein